MSHWKMRSGMKTKNFSLMRLLGFISLGAIVVVLGLALVGNNTGNANAKTNPAANKAAEKDKSKDKSKDKDTQKSLKVVSVTSPASFKGSKPFPITALAPNEKLLAVTIDYDRDFKNHLRSSESGEINLKDLNNKVYYTVGTALEPSAGPGKKPSRQATFVFSIPQNPGKIMLNYGQLEVDLGTP
jgi:hypothetical protein